VWLNLVRTHASAATSANGLTSNVWSTRVSAPSGSLRAASGRSPGNPADGLSRAWCSEKEMGDAQIERTAGRMIRSGRRGRIRSPWRDGAGRSVVVCLLYSRTRIRRAAPRRAAGQIVVVGTTQTGSPSRRVFDGARGPLVTARRKIGGHRLCRGRFGGAAAIRHHACRAARRRNRHRETRARFRHARVGRCGRCAKQTQEGPKSDPPKAGKARRAGQGRLPPVIVGRCGETGACRKTKTASSL
jgi:hypothetical protein